MNPHIRIGTVVAALALSTNLMAANVSLVSKQPGNPNGPLYTYHYTCNGGAQGTLTLSSATDSAAQKLAEEKARRICEEP